MRIDRFKTWLEGELSARSVQVERYQVEPGLTDLAVEGNRLSIVRTSIPGGEDFTEPENIVERGEGTTIKVTRP